MVTLMCTYEIQDFDQWKKVFDGNEEYRVKIGVNKVGVYRSIENPNQITFLLSAETEQIIKDMFVSPELKEKMKDAGVVSTPTLTYMNKV